MGPGGNNEVKMHRGDSCICYMFLWFLLEVVQSMVRIGKNLYHFSRAAFSKQDFEAICLQIHVTSKVGVCWFFFFVT